MEKIVQESNEFPENTIPKTFLIGGDMNVNRLGFGAMRIVPKGMTSNTIDAWEMKTLLKQVVELGINFIDTSDVYGPFVSEELIGNALSSYPEYLHIGTKVGLVDHGGGDVRFDGSREHIRASVEGSLRRLKLDRIDLYQLHRTDPNIPIEETMAVFRELQSEGKIKHIGLSEVTVSEIKRAQNIVPIATVQNQYNLLNRKHADALKYCEEQGIGFIPFYPLAAGQFLKVKNKILLEIAEKHNATVSQIALAWLLHTSPVMLPIPGTSSLAHLEKNVAAQDIKLTKEDMQELDLLV